MSNSKVYATISSYVSDKNLESPDSDKIEESQNDVNFEESAMFKK